MDETFQHKKGCGKIWYDKSDLGQTRGIRCEGYRLCDECKDTKNDLCDNCGLKKIEHQEFGNYDSRALTNKCRKFKPQKGCGKWYKDLDGERDFCRKSKLCQACSGDENEQ